MSKAAALEQAPVRLDDPWRMIALSQDDYTPLAREGSPWRRFGLPGGRVVLSIHREDLYRLMLDALEREAEGAKVSDTEWVLFRRLLHPAERDEVRRVSDEIRAVLDR